MTLTLRVTARNTPGYGTLSGVGTRILTVEDDERIRTAVKMALEDEGWTVEETASGEEAVDAFGREPADVVLIDIMLPGMDGFELCRSLRRSSDVPIVMVTARADTHDVVAGLEAGADDYLTKPFAPKELSARIRALLRRARPTQPGHARSVFGDLEIIPDEGKVLLAGRELHLTKTEFRLLVRAGVEPRPGVQPGDAARPGVGLRLLRRRPAGRRPRPPAAHQGGDRPGEPSPRGHRPRPRVPAAVVTDGVVSEAVATPPRSPEVPAATAAVAARPTERPAATVVAHEVVGRLRARRMGVRSRITLTFAFGAFALSLLLAGTTYALTRSTLVRQRDTSALRQAYVNARSVAATTCSRTPRRCRTCSPACRRRARPTRSCSSAASGRPSRPSTARAASRPSCAPA